MHRALRVILVATVAILVAMPGSGQSAAKREKLPRGAKLAKYVRRYLAAGEEERARMRAEADESFETLPDGGRLKRLRRNLLKIASKTGRKISFERGRHFFYDEKTGRGKYIVKPGNKTLFVGLHGGGVGSGSAESSAGSMGGGGWTWVFPEVLEKTGRGWTTSGTEEFLIELIDAAKRSGKVDPNRIYLTGHSMGGYGTWTVGAHHADVFAGTAAYAGAPSAVYADYETKQVTDIENGVLWNLYGVRHFFFQSLDDPRVTPESNVFANKRLLELKAEHPNGFDFRYVQVDDRGHAAPKEGYMPSQKWVAEVRRNARPKKILWQPVLSWKKHFYWLYWHEPERNAVLQAAVSEENVIDIHLLEGGESPQRLTVLLGEPLVDLDHEVVIRVDGEERFRGIVERTFSTLLLTLPRYDDDLLFDARVDL